jgi:hypothetical protein
LPDQPENSTAPEVDDADRVVGLISRLPHGSLIRRVALQVLQGRQLESVQPLTSSLMAPHPKRWRERIASAWALGRTPMSSEERDTAVQILLDIVEGSHREPFWNRMKRAGIHMLAAGFLLFVLIVMGDGPRFNSPLDFFMFFFAVCCFIGLFAVPLVFSQEKWNNNFVRAEAAESLGCIGSVEAVGTLAAGLRDRNEAVRAASAQSLHSLLPLISAEHYGDLGTETMISLGSALTHPDGQLVFKILAALEKAGTPAAIPYVERAVKRGRTHRIRETAEVVLRALNERRLRETERDRLLRPSTGYQDPSVLLRAHASAATEDPALLLQPSSEGG